MGNNKYYCSKCEYVPRKEYYSAPTCPYCSKTMSLLPHNEVVGGTLYNGFLYHEEKELKIPQGVKHLEFNAFSESKIESVVFPSTLEEIPAFCFYESKFLKDITVPGSVKKIESCSFSNCTSLKNVILCNGVEEIDDSAFSSCYNIKLITLPSSLKRIGDYALNCHTLNTWECQSAYKVIAIPDSVEEIGQEAFGSFRMLSKELRPIFLVHKKSFAEKYVKAIGFDYRIYSFTDGFLSTENNYNGTLYFQDKKEKIAKIEQGIEVIAERAFEGHAELKEVIFPDSLKEIQENAFAGCKSLKKIKFNCGIQRIGANAFCDADLQYVELPDTIEELASNAFNKECIVSVGGEMPGYREKLAELEEMRHKITNYKEELKKLEEEGARLENLIQTHNISLTDAVAKIPDLQQSKDELAEKIRIKTIEKNEKINPIAAQLSQIRSEINHLIEERNHCFFLALSRKKELDESIVAKKAKSKALQAEQDKLNSEYSTVLDNMNSQMKDIDRLLKQINDLTAKIKKEEETVANESKLLSTSHEKWAEKLKKIKEEKAVKDLEFQRIKLLSQLKVPEKANIVIKFDEIGASIDETLINAVYQRMIVNQVERDYAVAYNCFIENNTEIFEKIRELNLLLHMDSEDRLENFAKIEEPELFSPALPERFIKLNEYFNTDEAWVKLKEVARSFTNRKSARNFCDSFFQGTSYLRFQSGDSSLLLFPYCAVAYAPRKPLKVYTYNKLKISVSCKNEEQVLEKVPTNGELVSEHYMYENRDGTPSRRYKNNPLVKVVRYTNVSFSCGKKLIIKIPVKAYNTAVNFASAYDFFVEDLLTGKKKSIYKYIVACKDFDFIDAKMQTLVSAEKERELRKIKEAKEEEKRIREQRIATEKAAEQKRLEIIQHQKEINEERKRQATQQKEKEKQIAKLFDDDFVERSEELINDIKATAEEKLPVQIIGNRLISNTVFKIELCMTETLPDNSLTACFVDEQEQIISNRKRIDATATGETVKLGFVLNAGVDYSAMKRCFIQFESQGETIGRIDYKMNISFSPDIF